MTVRRKLALLTAISAVVMGLPAVANAQATADLTVELGFEIPHGFSGRTLAPLDHGVPTINVAKDAVVDLFGGGVILPEGQGPMEWHSENTAELDAPYGLISSDPDPDLEEPFPTEADYKFNTLAIDTPTDATCGATADDPCAVDGSTFFNGGDRFATADGHFFVKMTANPGTSLWVTSPFGFSRLVSLKINVVATGVDTQAFVDQAAAAIRAREVDESTALHEKLSKSSTSHRVNGQRVWDAYAGYDTDTFALLDFYPAKLKIHKGDKVRWHFGSLQLEQHGIAFPLSAAKDAASNGFIPVCDPDGDGAGPDEFTVDFETFTCPSGVLELDLSPALLAESGDGKFPGGSQQVENSGLRGRMIPSAPGIAGGNDPWDLTFTKATDSTGYKYICTFHGGFMNAYVVVRS
jgi:plastocyanin